MNQDLDDETNKSGEGELGEKNSKTNIRRTPIRHLKVLNYYEASNLTTQFPSFFLDPFVRCCNTTKKCGSKFI